VIHQKMPFRMDAAANFGKTFHETPNHAKGGPDPVPSQQVEKRLGPPLPHRSIVKRQNHGPGSESQDIVPPQDGTYHGSSDVRQRPGGVAEFTLLPAHLMKKPEVEVVERDLALLDDMTAWMKPATCEGASGASTGTTSAGSTPERKNSTGTTASFSVGPSSR
jgi:hypothetical protein